MDNKELFERAIHCFWPAILFKQKRKTVLNKLQNRFYTPAMRKSAPLHYDKMVEPWAFMRVHNERRTLKATLDSIDGVIHKGVIAHHGCTDGSEKIIHEFCKTHPGFIEYEYPYEVVPAHDPRYKGEVPYENTLAAYYEAVLSHIPKGEWFIKVDGDLVFFKDPLKYSFSLMAGDRCVSVYSRLNLYVDYTAEKREIYVLSYLRPGDQLLIKNLGISYRNEQGYEENGDFYAYEIMQKPTPRQVVKSECCVLHFPVEKRWRKSSIDVSELQTLTQFLETVSDDEIDKTLINEESVRKIVDSFVS